MAWAPVLALAPKLRECRRIRHNRDRHLEMLQRARLIARVAQEAGLRPAQLSEKLEQPSMLRRVPAWVFLGPPGVGKGTYASRVADALGIAHISAGDLVREEIKQQTDLGQQVRDSSPVQRMYAGSQPDADLIFNCKRMRNL